MNRIQLLAAETFYYSYANYKDHLGIGNERFERLMPKWTAILERATEERWPVEEVARRLGIEPDAAADYLESFVRARAIVDAENPAESFRNGVRYAIENALDEGLKDKQAIEKLVTQICYCAADLAYLLDMEGKPLSRYSRHLRKEPDVDYGEGHFDEED